MGQVMDLVAHQTEALWSPSSGYNKLFVPRDEVSNFAFFRTAGLDRVRS